MHKWFVVVLMLFATANSGFAQTKPAPADAAGGAYYEFMMGLQLEMPGRRSRRDRRISAR